MTAHALVLLRLAREILGQGQGSGSGYGQGSGYGNKNSSGSGGGSRTLTLCKLAKIYCGSKDKESKPYEGLVDRVKREWITDAAAAAAAAAAGTNHHHNHNNRQGIFLTSKTISSIYKLSKSYSPYRLYPALPYLVYPECAKYPLSTSSGNPGPGLSRDLCERVLQHMVLLDYLQEENVDNAR